MNDLHENIYSALSGLGVFVTLLFHRAMPCANIYYPFRVMTNLGIVINSCPERAKYISMGQRPMIKQTMTIMRPERAK